ncbi:putative quinol monooxygenase [Ornithinimicrobium pratense]|uniref:Antibiotic biosynthesis monooxygenase n=1 Tax=Ornithinimicrobium pratense TaxID=2593973 RepID=A0A5J6V520_9MICO|nr:putative quinol monooxygenase [Ornithinimicrobium pratense]QFG68113.1 antibiotic biosynthesis monooxygenase [Ornithinimicrobium pratense]
MTFANVGTLQTHPGRAEDLVVILTDSSADLGAHGCLQYDVGISADDRDTVVVIERWESAEAHASSLGLPAVQDAIRQAMPLLTGQMGGHRFEVLGSPLSGVST